MVKIKPLTLFLVFVLIAFIITAPLVIHDKLSNYNNMDHFILEIHKWRGIIKLWNIDNV